GVSRDLPAARCDVSGPAGASALPRGPVPGADRPVRHLPHGRARRLLPPGGPVAEAGVVAAGRAAGSLPAPHRDAAARGAAGGGHSDGAVHAARQGPPGGGDGGAKGRGAIRRAGAVSLPQAEPGLRPDPDRQPDQPGHRDLAPDFAVGPARLRGDPRPPARHPDRGVADLRAAALPAGRGRAHPEMKRVVVAHENQVVMEETLEAGLTRLFGGGGAVETAAAAAAPSGAAGPSNGAAADLARRAAALYQRAVAAQRSGDWARYGEALSQLGEVLRQLQAVFGGRQP